MEHGDVMDCGSASKLRKRKMLDGDASVELGNGNEHGDFVADSAHHDIDFGIDETAVVDTGLVCHGLP